MNRTTLFFLAIMLPVSAFAEDCVGAEKIFRQSLKDAKNGRALLEKAVGLCPSDTAIKNNLAVMLEEAGEWERAEKLYTEIIALDPNHAAAHAGLGDVLARRGQVKGAIASYQSFLDLLNSDKNRSLQAHRATYERKLATERKKLNPEAMVNVGEIVAALTQGQGGGKRAIRARPAQVDIPIPFEYDSDQVRGEAMKQVEQVAEALQVDGLQQIAIRIEGHTDDKGTGEYNRQLSERRAAEVKRLLVERYGIEASRLSAVGRGEEVPVVPNEDEKSRAINRRVTFINVGVTKAEGGN